MKVYGLSKVLESDLTVRIIYAHTDTVLYEGPPDRIPDRLLICQVVTVTIESKKRIAVVVVKGVVYL